MSSSTHEEERDDTTIVHSAPEDSPYVEPILTNPVPAHIPVLRQLGIAFLLLIVVFGVTYTGTLVALFRTQEPVSNVHVSTHLDDKNTEVALPTENPFDEVRVVGKSAFVFDVREGRALFNKNADESLPLASITKLMTALVAYELLDDSSEVGITTAAIRTDGDSGLKDGESFSRKDITDMVLIASSNDGAAALALAGGKATGLDAPSETLFLTAMNLRARELGLTNTRFMNATGLDLSPTEAGAYSSARDVALLLEYIITMYPEITNLTTEHTMRIYNETGEYHEVENTNEMVDSIDGLIASKTGFTELAGGNLVVAFEAGLNRPIIVAVLGSTFDDRFTDVKRLADAARAYALRAE